MPEKVYFVPVGDNEDPSSISKKLKNLLKETGFDGYFKKSEYVAVKTHFGEEKNRTYLHPVIVKTVIDRLKQRGVRCFLTETSTLYRGSRSNAVDHIELAYRHGFGYEKIGAPIIMADGLFGDTETSIPINGIHYKEVNIASEVAKIHGLVVLSHFKGHIETGFGGALKNIGMGLSSRMGKLVQHSVMKPEIIRSRCTGCGICIKWCPQDTIVMIDGKAYIESENCIGCGECLAVCQFGAVKFDWGRESNELQELIAEHAAGVIKAVNGRVFFINFIINVTRDCDCLNKSEIVAGNVGIVAGEDIVAVEKASYDLFIEKHGKPIEKFTYPGIDPLVQIRHASKIGLGSEDYEIVRM